MTKKSKCTDVKQQHNTKAGYEKSNDRSAQLQELNGKAQVEPYLPVIETLTQMHKILQSEDSERWADKKQGPWCAAYQRVTSAVDDTEAASEPVREVISSQQYSQGPVVATLPWDKDTL